MASTAYYATCDIFYSSLVKVRVPPVVVVNKVMDAGCDGATFSASRTQGVYASKLSHLMDLVR